MKKRAIIIESMVLVLVAAAVIAVSVFAWFTNNTRPDSNMGGLNIESVADLTFEFYRGTLNADGSVTYAKVQPSEVVDFADFVAAPGIREYFRVDVTNPAAADVSFNMSAKNVTYGFVVPAPTDPDAHTAAALVALGEFFYVEYGTQSESNADTRTKSDILAQLSGGESFSYTSGGIKVESGGTVSLYFEYVFSADYDGSKTYTIGDVSYEISALGELQLTIGTLRFGY